MKRLTRPAHPPGFRITDRDIAILAAVARFRFLSSQQIVRVIPGSEHALLVRLKLLFFHQYLDRPRHQHAQLAMFFDEGNRPLVYGLARKGAQLLASLGLAVDAKLDWTLKNARATSAFLAHTLETADAVIAFDQAARAAGLRLIDQPELRALLPEARRNAHHPFRCTVAVRTSTTAAPVSIGVVPDRMFSLVLADNTRHNFALEIDRATMDVHAGKIAGKSSFRRKLLSYFSAWREGLHTQAWNFRNFRILTITTSPKRIDTMLRALRDVTRGAAPGLFLFTTRDRLSAHGALGDAWMNGSGEITRLIR